MYHACLWRYENLFGSISTSSIPCNNNDGSGYKLKCKNCNNLITSTLTILFETNKNFTVHVDCQKNPVEPAVTEASLDLIVTGEIFPGITCFLMLNVVSV